MSTGTGKPVKQQKSEKFLIAALRSSTKKLQPCSFTQSWGMSVLSDRGETL